MPPEQKPDVHLFDDFQDFRRQLRLLPEPDGLRDVAALDGDVVILSEDSPIAVGHLRQLLLGPVTVVPLLLLLPASDFAKSLSGDKKSWITKRAEKVGTNDHKSRRFLDSGLKKQYVALLAQSYF